MIVILSTVKDRGATVDDQAGTLVTETFDYDGGRPVTVYVPPDPPEAVVFAADGQRVARWGGLLETADVPPTMIVGVHGLADEMARLQEYSPVFDAGAVRGPRAVFRRGRRPLGAVAVRGRAARRADGGVRRLGGRRARARPGASPSRRLRRGPVRLARRRVPAARRAAGPLPRVYLVAGTQEPFFLDNANRWAAALRDAGADVVLSERDASHGSALWRGRVPADGGVGVRAANKGPNSPVL